MRAADVLTFSRILLACAASTLGSMATACPNSNGGAVFQGAPVDLCFPNQVADLTAPLTDFMGSAKPDSMLIFAWLSERTTENESVLSTREKDSMAALFFQDVADLTITPLEDTGPPPFAVAVLQVAWPSYGTHHGANCVIFLKDSLRLVYCGGVRDNQGLPGSYDLFKPTAAAVLFN